ncbi:MAG TPA: primosomal protein N', partial [Miltoncostaeaceae bacterium]|nr:primosomal protein N' [Miltoncostaeaceae bacterium]
PYSSRDSPGAAAARIAAAAPGESLLLYGVTGSGKTEVYLRAIAAARAAGRGTIVLAPEISLTPQLLQRMRARLGPRVALWHSGMSPAERAAAYARIRDGRADVVVGARSAVFAPVRDLGLLVVDEEHDASYKQDATPHYDARQLAYRRARTEGAVAVYGSATPRPETWHALPRVELSARVDGSPPPRVEVVDMRTQGAGPLSRPLARALRDAMESGGKAVLLLNRRGFALRALCGACGHTVTCPRCDVALVQHEEPRRLACHHCGHEEAIPTVCARCGAAQVMRGGVGTQGLEQAIARVVPRARLVRLDASTAAARGSVARLLAEFARPGAAVLLGTQMVAKGHDLPDVTLAAVLDADAGLRQADFRAEERTFALIVQAAGRAGRRGERARVIVQAWEPAGRAVALAAALDVPGFLAGELTRRSAHGMPPFGHLVRVVVEGPERGPVVARARGIAAAAAGDEVTVLGPAPMHRLRGRWRRSVLARAERSATALAAVREAVAAGDEGPGGADLRVVVDVDPQSL